ncbi:MAG: hypothetical protein AAFY28_18190, partial [Actinomycetota bacterium]
MEFTADPLRTVHLRLVPVRRDDVDALFRIARTPASIEDYQRAASRSATCAPGTVAHPTCPNMRGR